MKNYLIEKTNDVRYGRNLIDTLGASFLLFSRDYELTEYLTCDISLLKRRSRIFGDTDRIPGMKKLLDETVTAVSHIAQMVRMQNSFRDNERGLYSVKQLGLYVDVIDSLNGFYGLHAGEFQSEDYIALFGDIAHIAASPEYIKIKTNAQKLTEQITGVKSISVGFNFDESLSPCESGIISVNDDYVKSGLLIDRILRMDDRKGAELLSMAPLVPPKKLCGESEYETLNFSLYAALSKIFRKQIRQWEPEINAYISKHLGFLIDMLPDLKFVSDIVGIEQKMRQAGLTLCLPEYYPKEEKVYRAKNLYNPVLAMNQAQTGKSPVVKSDLTFDVDGGIYLLSGPNNGGKTVFMCAVGIVQIMAQVGMPVPADRLEISPASGIFAELPKYQAVNDKGRLADECSKISAIFRETDNYSVCLFDEAFSSTDPKEAVGLSVDVLHAMSYLGIRGIYASHLHELADYADELNTMVGAGQSKIDYLVAGISKERERTYRIVRRRPDGKSYAKTIADRYGISFDRLICKECTVTGE